ncbi:MAG TPA: hypothetical protein DDY58_06485 [Terrisporobacter glycolicus]|uniref:hypothetical protein n=1 Tax=Terrisporobacter TaxID=1505652 RepID=UPI000E9114DA|nr:MULTISPECIES: hypothetical protein [Terrisporobacter]HBI92096.1 hypothetical protein [Terrisporobacter hibernicus]
MKLLVNGNMVSEMIKCKLNNRYNEKDLSIVDKMIDHIKTNKIMYAKLIFTTALMLHFNINCNASGFEDSLDRVGNQIVDMLLSVAKWGCIGMGIKNMIGTMLNGGSMKQASTEGIQYFLGYLFIQFFPQLFDLFKGIKF